MTKADIAKMLGMISAAFPTMRPPTEEMIDVWHSLLGDIPAKVGVEAVRKCLLHRRFAPTIAEVREAYAEVAFPGLLGPDEALAEVMCAIRAHGNSAEVGKTVSPLSAHVVRQIGLWELCYADNQAATQADFRRLYALLLEKERAARLEPGYKALALITGEKKQIGHGNAE